MKTDVIIIRIIAKDEVSTIFPVLPGSPRHKKKYWQEILRLSLSWLIIFTVNLLLRLTERLKFSNG